MLSKDNEDASLYTFLIRELAVDKESGVVP